jgi:LCP family protein required for cell wall assembly
MGCDNSGKLTDSILVVAIERDSGKVNVLQIPRDTYANYTQRDYKKINGAWNVLGNEGIKTLCGDILGVRIHYFAILSLSGFRAFVDAVDGVDVDIPMDMRYEDPEQGLEIHLPAGAHHLDGRGAEQFVRFRSGYANADLGRLDAQKQFLRAVAKKCQSLSPAQLCRVMGIALTNLQTDFPLPQGVQMLSAVTHCDVEQIDMETLPGQAIQGSSGAWYYCANRAGLCRAVNQLLFPPRELLMEQIDPKGLLNRTENADFYAIYNAPEELLPLG